MLRAAITAYDNDPTVYDWREVVKRLLDHAEARAGEG
jgi:hypothetical protein